MTLAIGDEIRIPNYSANNYSGRIISIDKETVTVLWYIHRGKLNSPPEYVYKKSVFAKHKNECKPGQFYKINPSLSIEEQVNRKIDYLWKKQSYTKGHKYAV